MSLLLTLVAVWMALDVVLFAAFAVRAGLRSARARVRTETSSLPTAASASVVARSSLVS